MSDDIEIVVTGLGVASPIGIGVEPFWQALVAGESGIRPVQLFDASALSVRFGGQIPDFDARLHVRPRKSLKVMSREMQIGFAAADLALADARIEPGVVPPERMGIVFGADMIYAGLEDLESAYRRARRSGSFDYESWSAAILEEVHPLWLLKHLPNMTASHVAIAHDARGPNNTIVLGEVSGLLAVSEAASLIARGWADIMIAGGTGCRLHPTALVARGESQLSHRSADCRAACRPFERDRDGIVNGEGAAALVLESRRHAADRGARVRARLVASSARCEPALKHGRVTGSGLRLALRQLLASAGWRGREIGHVNAHAAGAIDMDRIEAEAIAAELGPVPVTANKSLFGSLGAGGAAVELVAAILAVERGLVPRTLNYEAADPACPVQVVAATPLAGRPATALKTALCSTGQAVAVMIAAA